MQLLARLCQLRKDALSNSVIDMYGNCTQSKIPFYPIQIFFVIFNTQWEFEYPIKWKMCAYATQWVKKNWGTDREQLGKTYVRIFRILWYLTLLQSTLLYNVGVGPQWFMTK